jgi:phage tail-like protein
MVTDSYYPPVAFYFSVSFKGVDAGFQEVSGISKEVGIEEITSGGENRFKYKLPTVTTSQNLILKRGVVPAGSKLISWCAQCIDGGLATPIQPQDIMVSLLGADGMVIKKWMFYKAWPVKYSLSEMHSQRNEILVETIELAYTYFDINL